MRERFRERWRDKTRDNLISALNSLGVRAKMAERGRAEEEGERDCSRALLESWTYRKGPIRWINVVKQDGGQHNPPRWWLVFCVPDEERGHDPGRPARGGRQADNRYQDDQDQIVPAVRQGNRYSVGRRRPQHRIAQRLRRRCGHHEPREEDPQPGDLRVRQRVPRMDAAGGGALPPVAPALGSPPLYRRSPASVPVWFRTRHRPARRCSGGDSSMV